MAKVLVGILTWNRPHLVITALQSVRQQTLTDIRIIVSDNCSPAEVANQIENHILSLNDPRIEFVKQPVNRGEKGQLEYLLSQCEEEFIVFLHDDDRMEPQLLESALTVFSAHPSVDFYGTDQYVFDLAGNVLPEETQRYRQSLNRHQLDDGLVPDLLVKVLRNGIFSTSGSVFRSATLRECGLQDSETTFPCDFNVFLRQAENNRIAWWNSSQLVGYRFHSDQTRNQCCWEYNELYIKGFIEMLAPRRFSGEAEHTRKWLLSFGYRRYAYIMFSKFRLIKGYQYLYRAVAEDPLNYRVWGYVGLAGILPFLIPPLWKNKVTPVGTTNR
jgi:glycosyltransferase involved in cell wall biosynthesis